MITPEKESEVLTLYQRGFGRESIARETNLSQNTVKYIVGARLTKGKSLRAAILTTLTDDGDDIDVGQLRQRLGRRGDLHNITHVLHNLHTAGRIDFKEAGARDHLEHIVLRKRVPRVRAVFEPSTTIPVFEDDYGEASAGGGKAEAPPAPAYPLLEALREREGQRMEQDEKAMAFVVAAEAIEAIDPELAASLVEKGRAYDAPYPSPIEQEYMRYVEDHP